MKKIVLLLLIIPTLIFSQEINQKFISVRGVSEKSITPDWIELEITFSETENVKKDNELQQKEKELKNLIKSFNIDLEHLKVYNFYAKRYNYYKSYSNKIRMSKSYKLKLNEINLADTLIIELFKIGANEVIVTNLHSDKIKDIRLEATKEALDNAKVKAETMVNYSGKTLGDILEIKEYNPECKPGNYGRRSDVLYKAAYNVSGGIVQKDGDIGVRKIKITYVVDVKYIIND